MTQFASRFRRIITPPYSKKDLPTIILSLFFLLMVPILVIFLSRENVFNSQAQEMAILEVESGSVAPPATTPSNDPIASGNGNNFVYFGNAATGIYPSDITNFVPSTMPNLSMPSYLQTVTDPVFNTNIKRIADLTTMQSKNNLARHVYAKNQPWNADESLIMLDFDYPAFLLRGSDYTFIKKINQPSEAMWSNTDPNSMYGHSGNKLVKYNVNTNTTTVVHTFSNYSDISLGQYEGNLSTDDRYLALVLGSNSSSGQIAVYDLSTDTIVATMPLPHSINNVSMSQSGKYVVVQWDVDGTGTAQGIDSYTNTLQYIRKLSPRGGTHFDLGYDTAGNEVIVVLADNTRALEARRLNATGNDMQVLDATQHDYNTHISTRNTERPGWAYISQFGSDAGTANYQTIFAVKLDGSKTVQQFAHEYHSSNGGIYEHAPMAVPNHDGSKVIFASDWLNTNASAPIYSYVAGAADAVLSAPPASTPSCPSVPTTLGVVTATVTIAENAPYTIWSRINPQDSQNNSYWLEVEGYCPINVGDASTLPSNTWTWVDYKDGSEANKITLNLTPKTYIVKLYGREAGLKLDKLLFSSDPACIPTETGNCLQSTPTQILPTPTQIPSTSTPTPTGIPASDQIPPSIIFVTPANSAIVARKSSVTMAVNANDASGIAKVEFFVNGSRVCTDASITYTCTLRTGGARGARYTLSAKAYDKNNNTKSTSITITSR